jgi:hypothetical protein
MCKVCDQIEAEFAAFNATGELPTAWDDDIEFDRRVAEINAELEDIAGGCVEPPRFGWLYQIQFPDDGDRVWGPSGVEVAK